MLEENKYNYLYYLYTKTSNEMKCDLEDIAIFSNDPEEIIDVDDLDDSIQNLVVIDDFGDITHKLFWESVSKLFTKCRKKNTSIVFVGHDLNIPSILKRNCNYITLFGFTDKVDMTSFKRQFPLDITNDEFEQLYKPVTENKHNFLFIDKVTDDPKLKYRINLDNKLIVNK